MPKLSIIVPVYNKEAYLEESIKSLLAQTFQDLEIVCVDNGSTDNSPAILSRMAAKDERIRILSETEQKGPSVARNVGIAAARGEYIGFLDADDFVDPALYERLFEALEETGADIAVCGQDRYDEEHDVYIYPEVPEGLGCIRSIDLGGRMFFSTLPNVFTKLFKASLIRDHDISFPVDVTTGEDMCFSFEGLMRAEKIAFIPDILCHYRQGVEGALTHVKSERGTEIFTCFAKLEKVIDSLDDQSSFREGLLNYVVEQTRYVLSIAANPQEYEAQFAEYKTEWHPRVLALKERIYEATYQLVMRFEESHTPLEFLFIEQREKNQFLEWNCAEFKMRDLQEAQLRKEIAQYKRQLEVIQNSKTFKVGTMLFHFPRKFRDILKRNSH